jgi:hypothetical protein
MGKMSAISQFVPGTQARASRLFGKSLRKKAKGADAVLWVEYVDGDVKLKRAKWDGEINGWVTKQGKRFFPRGKGGDPKRINGVPIVQCHASDAGVVSTEAAMATGALEEGLVAPLDHRGRVLGPIPEGRTDQDPEAVQQEVDAAIENGELNVDAPENGDSPGRRRGRRWRNRSTSRLPRAVRRRGVQVGRCRRLRPVSRARGGRETSRRVVRAGRA